jgi:hypothetical protein
VAAGVQHAVRGGEDYTRFRYCHSDPVTPLLSIQHSYPETRASHLASGPTSYQSTGAQYSQKMKGRPVSDWSHTVHLHDHGE